ncbi:type II toxin-antitoxin system Phd/YefM family antitoxin [Micromonospora ureilytica]|uniref:Prevent-host-death family protein n=1 Tax=Micromonospora ureilytica TaxID=709868 RepID=A0ABS0JBP1_9ACTN|nr:type II toxin-antitoxin system prevent-host-death family antitoxin [Micromonospora ureilytica]MBG6064483.1 prevent-host-death family protein [Micromonospora ureilytica]
MPEADHADVAWVPHVPLREAKASFSELVARADLLGEVTVLTKHGRPAAVIAPTHVGGHQALLAELWALLDRLSPPGEDPHVDDARSRQRRERPLSAPLVSPVAAVNQAGR